MEERPMPERGPGEALVRVKCVGICGSDLHAFQGNQPYFSYPRIMGHELSGEIVEIGENTRGLKAGDRCVVNPYLACGRCIACRRGKTNCCVGLEVFGVHVDGGMQEYVTLPLENLIPSDKLTFEQMALVENQCIGAHAVRRADLDEGEYALVIGAGSIGLGVIQFAKNKGARVIVLDLSARRLAFCRDTLGVEHTLDASKDPEEILRAVTSGDMPTAVFDATGSPPSMKQALRYAAHGGQIILVGLVQAEIGYFHPDFHKREMTLKSTRNAIREDFENVIRGLEQGRVDVGPMITHRTPFDKMIEAFEGWLDPDSGVIKSVVTL